MKFRTQYVSNSSSSSFIIGIPNDKPMACTHCGRTSPDITGVITQNYRDADTSIEWDDVDYRIGEIEKEQGYCIQAGYGRDKYLDEEMEILEKAKSEFTHILGLSVSYHDELVLHLLDEMNNMGEIKILYSGD